MSFLPSSIRKHLPTILGIILLLLISFAGIFLTIPDAGKPTTEILLNTPQSPTTTLLAITSTDTATAVPQPTSTVTGTPSSLPDSFYIADIHGHRQVYSLGCEASVAVDWANYFGTTIYEYTFQTSLPHSDNPDFGFVGDVNSVWGQIPPYAYGVNAGPVADLLVKYGLPAKAVKGYTLAEVKQKLAESKPIIVWVIGNMEWSPATEYTDSLGNKVLVAAYEHVVILTGYTKKTIRYMSNGNLYDTPTDVFLNSWGVLGNQAVIYE
ncbi:MAG: C39 family peptidase [Anaerolineaceae bacterium]